MKQRPIVDILCGTVIIFVITFRKEEETIKRCLISGVEGAICRRAPKKQSFTFIEGKPSVKQSHIELTSLNVKEPSNKDYPLAYTGWTVLI